MSNTSEDMLVISHLSKRYYNSDSYAVEDLSLNIHAGEMFGFLGLNGAGKSTTIKCATGVYPFDEGSITVAGYDIKQDPINAKRNLSYVADNHRVYEKLTGKEFVNHTADIYKVSLEQRKQVVDEYAKKFRLTSALDKQIKGYSHGMKQKICIIAALVHQPRLWILDEPLMGLDPQSCHDIIEAMKEHCRAGNTVFFSSHNIDMVAKICDRVAIINKGKLCEVVDLSVAGAREGLEEKFLGYSGGEFENPTVYGEGV